MAISQNQTSVITNYNDVIKKEIINSGGTIIFVKNNCIIASEITEGQYRDFLKNPYIEKIDVVPLKSYGDAQPITSTEITNKPIPTTTTTKTVVANTVTTTTNVPVTIPTITNSSSG
jgi:hypothetical protein